MEQLERVAEDRIANLTGMLDAFFGGQTPLSAKSPYELRVNLGAHVPESDVRTALATGDMGFLHSFTTGSTVDGPGVRLVAWTAGCMWRCLYSTTPIRGR